MKLMNTPIIPVRNFFLSGSCLGTCLTLIAACSNLAVRGQDCIASPDALEVIRSEMDGIMTVYTTFEGGTYGGLIHPESDNWIPCSGMRFSGPSGGGIWRTVTTPPATVIFNMPSGKTVAFWPTSTSTQMIMFDKPVSEVFLQFAANGTVELRGLDANFEIIAIDEDEGNGRPYDVWKPMSVSVPRNDIVGVAIVRKTGTEMLVDDVGYRRKLAVEIAIDVKPGNDNEIDPINLRANGSLPLVVFSTPTFDARTLNTSTLQLGDPNLIQISTVVFGHAEDLDGDGLLDAVLNFSASQLVDGGAMNPDTTKLLLTGNTAAGIPVFGNDSVRIVGASQR